MHDPNLVMEVLVTLDINTLHTGIQSKQFKYKLNNNSSQILIEMLTSPNC